MKLTYLSFARIPSLEANSLQIMKMCGAFAGMGYDVELHTPNYPMRFTYTEVDDPHSYYGVARKFRLARLPPRPWMRPGHRHSTWYSVMSGLRAFQRGGVAYGRDLRSCAVAAWLGVPVGYEMHVPMARGSRLFEFLIRAPGFRKIVTISGALSETMLENYPALKNRITVAHDGADLDENILNEPDNTPREGTGLRVGYIGSLYPGKGLEIITTLAGRCPWAKFEVVGGSPREVAEQEALANGLRNLQFHGHLPFAQASDIRRSCDVLLAPYQRVVRVAGGGADVANWMSPLKLFEYMSAGKAIICSDLPVLREILADGENALMCAPDDIDAWVNALARLENPSLRRQLGTAAYELLRGQYTWTRRSEIIADSVWGQGK